MLVPGAITALPGHADLWLMSHPVPTEVPDTACPAPLLGVMGWAWLRGPAVLSPWGAPLSPALGMQLATTAPYRAGAIICSSAQVLAGI